mgnify:CR=1 FL=1
MKNGFNLSPAFFGDDISGAAFQLLIYFGNIIADDS